MRALRALPALLLIGAAPAQRYVIDAAHSDVSARVAFFGLASKTAHFPKVSGGIVLSPDTPERINLSVDLDATALTAPDRVTLERLKGPKFFDVVRYPAIRFRGQSMRLMGDREAEVAGEITARGVTRPATLSVRFATPPLRAEARAPLTLDAETVIDRRQFGMTAYPLIVGRRVTIRLRVVLDPA
jgi:polyisoprenoid-binding protein YceI